MAKLIVKSPYIKGSSGGAGGYAKYIGTRDGVELLPSGYMEYMSERPRSHGLFGDKDNVDLNSAMKELNEYPGNIWTHIISLKREDAERLGYDHAAQWKNLLRAHRNEIAEAMHIPPSDFRWYAAFHDEGDHPHIHMMAWSAKPGQAYLSQDGIRQIKSKLTNDIFRQEMLHLDKISFEDSGSEQTATDFPSLPYDCWEQWVIMQDDTAPLVERDEAAAKLIAIAEGGDLYAQYLVGRLYQDGPVLIPDSVEALHWFEQAVRQGHPAASYEMGKILLSDDAEVHDPAWGMQWLEQMAVTLRPSTLEDYRKDMANHVKPHLGSKLLTQVAASDLRKLYDTLKRNGRMNRRPGQSHGLSSNTVHVIHTTLYHALKVAKEQGLIPTNPADEVDPPKVIRQPMKILNEEQLDAFMDVIRQDAIWYDFFYTELTTGLRRGDICGLMWNDLNLRTGELRIERQVHRVKGELVVSSPKTKSSNRNIILPAPVLSVLKAYKKSVASRWMFPSPVSEESPREPAAVRKRLQIVLERVECKKVRFHDLRHVFCTTCPEHGMDIKTLSTIIGHVSSSTTLNVYAHVTDEMRRTAAVKIDQGIGKAEPQEEAITAPLKPALNTFQAHKGQRRKPGTGCVSQINDHLWEGRYSPIWPDGKKHTRNIYAHSEAECKTMLAEMIVEMKAEIAAEKDQIKIAPKAS